MNLVRTLWQHQVFRLLVVILAIVTGIMLLILLIFLGYQADWTGFNRHLESVHSGQQELPAKTLWDWMQLLIIPIVLAVGAFLLNFATTRTEQKIAAQRYKDDQKIAEQRYENDQKIALDKQREDLLQIYLDRMSELLLEKDLRTSLPEAEVRNVARVRTLTVLGQLDTTRKNAVLSFLREAKLVTSEPGKSIVSLSQATMDMADLQGVDFSGVDLSYANLSKANLSRAFLHDANLRDADLTGAILFDAGLSRIDLRDAELMEADLTGAILFDADLSGANLHKIYFSRALLNGANLTGANLTGANLTGANLTGANLSGTNIDKARGVTQKQLSTAKTTA